MAVHYPVRGGALAEGEGALAEGLAEGPGAEGVGRSGDCYVV